MTVDVLEKRGSKWPIKRYSTSIYESFNNEDTIYTLDLDNTYYLSPDAEEALEDFDYNTNFIIGGLIDRTCIRNASKY
jgi:Trm5-related predicted tRNA methylase